MPLHITEEEKAPKRIVVSSNVTEDAKKKHNKSDVDIDEVTLEIYCKGIIFSIFLISIIIVALGTIALVKFFCLIFKLATGIVLIVVGAVPSGRYAKVKAYNDAILNWEKNIVNLWKPYTFRVNGTTMNVDTSVRFNF
jgi:hypothetical protein